MRSRIFSKYHGLCGRCLVQAATSVHEIIPRSAGGDLVEKNQIPLCGNCHVIVQSDWQSYVVELYEAQSRARTLFGNDIQIGGPPQ